MNNYNSSVFCHCFAKETRVDLYGSFWRAEGVCPTCKRTYIATQTPIGEGNTRYEITEKRGFRALVGDIITFADEITK